MPHYPTMRIRLTLIATLALALSACGGGDDDASGSVAEADQAACDSAYDNGGDAAGGDMNAADALLADLGDAGPDDDYSDAISGRLQILAADALLISSGSNAPNIADHVDAAYAACSDLGWKPTT